MMGSTYQSAGPIAHQGPPVNQSYAGPKQSRQQQMYSSIISSAVQQSVFNQAANAAAINAGSKLSTSVKSASGIGRMSHATRSTAAHDGKVNIGLSTSSSMRSQDNMPHLIPQKTNVLTGAATKYFSN